MNNENTKFSMDRLCRQARNMKKLLLFLLILPSLACFMGMITPATSTAPTATMVIKPRAILSPLPTVKRESVCTVTAEKLNMRTNPDSPVIAWLYKGDLVTFLGETRGKWIKIRAGDLEGWINSKYCEVNP